MTMVGVSPVCPTPDDSIVRSRFAVSDIGYLSIWHYPSVDEVDFVNAIFEAKAFCKGAFKRLVGLGYHSELSAECFNGFFNCAALCVEIFELNVKLAKLHHDLLLGCMHAMKLVPKLFHGSLYQVVVMYTPVVQKTYLAICPSGTV